MVYVLWPRAGAAEVSIVYIKASVFARDRFCKASPELTNLLVGNMRSRILILILACLYFSTSGFGHPASASKCQITKRPDVVSHPIITALIHKANQSPVD